LEDTAVEGAGGYYTPRLVFPITLEVAPALPTLMIVPELRGTLVLADDPDQNYLGLLVEPRERLLGPGKTQRRIHCDLSPAILTHVEQRRAGNDLRLRARILGSMFEVSAEVDPPDMDASSPWLKGGRRHLIAYGECYANLDLNIPRSIWVDRILPNLGYCEKRLLEFSIPKSAEMASEFKKALAELELADREYVKGAYGEVIVRCRSALIAATSAFKLDLGDEKAQFRIRVRAFKEQYLVPVVGETQGQLVADLMESLWVPLSAGSKPDGRQADKEYSELILSLTCSTLAYVGRALRQT
jgi:hypothetical protein